MAQYRTCRSPSIAPGMFPGGLAARQCCQPTKASVVRGSRLHSACPTRSGSALLLPADHVPGAGLNLLHLLLRLLPAAAAWVDTFLRPGPSDREPQG